MISLKPLAMFENLNDSRYLEKFHLSKYELWLLTGLLMERIIRNINGDFYFEVPQKGHHAPSSSLILEQAIAKLLQNNLLKVLPNSAFLHLTQLGYEKAISILDVVNGSVYDPPKEIKNAIKI